MRLSKAHNPEVEIFLIRYTYFDDVIRMCQCERKSPVIVTPRLVVHIPLSKTTYDRKESNQKNFRFHLWACFKSTPSLRKITYKYNSMLTYIPVSFLFSFIFRVPVRVKNRVRVRVSFRVRVRDRRRCRHSGPFQAQVCDLSIVKRPRSGGTS